METSLKQFARLAAATLGGLALSLAAHATPVLSYNGHDYYYATPASDWATAEAQAIGMGGHLVAINDAAEQAALVAAFGGTERLWIGLFDSGVNVWTWVNGDAVSYTNWAAGEPNNLGNEKWTVMNWRNPGDWNNLPNNGCCTNPLTPLRGIIEVVHVPEPGSLALAGLALTGLWVGRRRRA